MQNPCATPGMKIRSKGRGRGLARGKGEGPMGIPYKEKERSPLGKPKFNSGTSPLKGYRGMKSPLV